MYKTIVTPDNRELSIIIPSNLVGKEIEVSATAVKKNRKKKFTIPENRAFYKKFHFGKLKLSFTREEMNER